MSRELDPQAATFLTELEDEGVLPTHALAVPTARRKLEDLFGSAPGPDADSSAVDSILNVSITGPSGPIPLRIYRPAGDGPHPVTVFFHGGGWVLGSLAAYDGTCRTICDETGGIVVSVDYRLAPEHPFPAGFEDAYRAIEWTAEQIGGLHGDPDRIAVCGDSAGGNLAAAVSLASRDRNGPDLVAQALIYPALNHPERRWFEAYDENAEGYFLELESMRWFYDHYLANRVDTRNPYALPLEASDLSGLPPAILITCEFDPLRDEGMAYADRLTDAGVTVEHNNEAGMIHAYLSLRHHIDRGWTGLEELGERLGNAFET